MSTKQDRFPNAGIIHFSDNEKKFFANSDFRFLTPRECFLLMGFSDKDYERVRNLELPFAKELLLAGNSIIVNVMESVFYTVAKVLGDT
ncbi:MAG: DNA cytosine methyltransferase [Bacilli bacterium]